MCLEYCAVCPLGHFYQQVRYLQLEERPPLAPVRGGIDYQFLYGASSGISYFRSVGNVFSVHGYELHLSDTVNTTTLVLGISTLIVAEVFAIGLKMKEEQDLTI